MADDFKYDYIRLRRNIIRRTKSLFEKGYYADEKSLQDIIPPKYSDLEKVTLEDIQNLRDIQKEQIPKLFKYLEVDEYGEVKEVPYSEHLLDIARKSSKKSKIKAEYNKMAMEYELSKSDNIEDENEDDDFIYTDDQYRFLENTELKIASLMGFVSSSKDERKASRAERIVHNIGEELYNNFITAKERNFDGLINRIWDNTMLVTTLLDRALLAYLEEDNGAAVTEELNDIILGTVSEQQAQKFDNGYGSPVSRDDIDDLPLPW